MKHANIAIFVPHIGCPHRCSFCDQRTISGTQRAPAGEDVRRICTQGLSEVEHPENAEIAFFGGSFTAIPERYMRELLDAAADFVGEGKFSGIRVSTRPDCITPDILDILKNSGVTAIELGAQSMSDEVLAANERGHSADDVERSSALIREYGFELGLQMMMGLYSSTEADERLTFDKICAIHPDTLRIYPVVILENTRLGELFRAGEYETFPFETVVDMAAEFLTEAEKQGIRVIKCGLHASEFVERDMLGGFYHPAFRELCESRIYRRKIAEILPAGKGTVTIAVHPSCISKAIGQRRSNIEFFGGRIKIIGDENVPKFETELR